MLLHSFIHVPGIGTVSEKRLWNNNIHTWNEALNTDLDIPRVNTHKLRNEVRSSLHAYQNGEANWFAQKLPGNEAWRALHDFDNIAYLDIETTGLTPFVDEITVIGLYDGENTYQYVKGENLKAFFTDIQRYDVIVTFNGKQFDAPFIERSFPKIALPKLHVDLRFALKRLGHTGGLKNIEKELGVNRGDDVEDLSGSDAVRLWRAWEDGDENAKNILLEYNEEDIVNLKDLAHYTYASSRQKLLESTGLKDNEFSQ